MFKRQPVFLMIIIAFALFGSRANASPLLQKASSPLFEPAPQVSGFDAETDPTVVRSRAVTVDFTQLGGAADGRLSASSVPEMNDVVQLNLFDDVAYTAILDKVDPLSNGGYAWIGHIQDVDHSQVIFIVNQGQTAGNIASPDGFYGVRYAEDATHVILEIDQSAFPGDDPIPVTEPETPAPIQAADDGSQIDVMVAYTGSARQGAGGTTAMEGLINLAVAETNESYANSGINQRLNLVHTVEVNYTETGNMNTELSRLESTSDNYMDDIHDLRNTHRADLVVLIVENGGAYCGLAYLMTNVSSSFEDNAFSIVARNCATGYFSFGHELGHNMGARHDWTVDQNLTPYPYSHGYVNEPDRWRTIMAYNTQCSPASCLRLPYWSNPGVTYGGDPMGVPISGQPEAPDNHRTLNNTASTVANFRDSGGTPSATGPLIYSSHTVDDNTINQSNGNNNGIPECGETIEMFTWLRNQGSNSATGVSATLSTSSLYVSLLYNIDSAYPNIAGGSSQRNSDDFDFAISDSAPDGHQILFNLNITAGNGGPWSTSFIVPVTCAPTGDAYEPDDSSSQARSISSGSPQIHSIYPVGDEDWATFTLDVESAVTLQTSGTAGDDTRMWLYNSSQTQIDYNDDIDYLDGNYFSRITRECSVNALPAGTYDVKVDEYGNNNTISSYNLALAVTPCIDTYEPDDSPAEASEIASGSPQTHKISPATDEDWVYFTVPITSGITLETSGTSGDTQMWLYADGNFVNDLEHNDDGGDGLFSLIDRMCGVDPLPQGTYYAKIDEYGNNNEIASYDLSLTAGGCSYVYLPAILK